MNYFAIERGDSCWDKVLLNDENHNLAFEDLMQMSYEEMKRYERLDEFVCAVMDATNEMNDEEDQQTAVTLVGEDGVFIWGLIIGPSEIDDELHYVMIDWKKDGKNYRYSD